MPATGPPLTSTDAERLAISVAVAFCKQRRVHNDTAKDLKAEAVLGALAVLPRLHRAWPRPQQVACICRAAYWRMQHAWRRLVCGDMRVPAYWIERPGGKGPPRYVFFDAPDDEHPWLAAVGAGGDPAIIVLAAMESQAFWGSLTTDELAFAVEVSHGYTSYTIARHLRCHQRDLRRWRRSIRQKWLKAHR